MPKVCENQKSKIIARNNPRYLFAMTIFIFLSTPTGAWVIPFRQFIFYQWRMMKLVVFLDKVNCMCRWYLKCKTSFSSAITNREIAFCDNIHSN